MHILRKDNRVEIVMTERQALSVIRHLAAQLTDGPTAGTVFAADGTLVDFIIDGKLDAERNRSSR